MRQEGGSWEVRVSLAAVGNWLRSLGRLEPSVAFGEGKPAPPKVLPQDPEIAALSVSLVQSSEDSPKDETKANAGKRAQPRMTAIKHAAELSVTPVREGEAPLELNTHEPKWLLRTED